jgi:very-short-patch-repair endonuclease
MKEWMSLQEILQSQEFKEYMGSHGKLNSDLSDAKNYYQELTVIKDFYLANEAKILSNPKAWATSYPTDWSRVFTPIEFDAWCTIRRKGRIVLYPQYPALNYFLDFANPALKIGLELDGKKFHDMDRDLIRDTELRKSGWTIYRITGTEMSTNYKEISDIEEAYLYDEDEDDATESLRHWLYETGDGVIQAIREVYFLNAQSFVINDYITDRYHSFCLGALEKHQSNYSF